jgi:divalent metal cation (Fe/Co/Zn/Cd) transporter
MTSTDRAARLVGRGKALDWITLGWNPIGVIVLAFLATVAALVARVSEGRVAFIDGLLASAVLLGLVLDLTRGWWWADPLAGCVIVYYAAREALSIFRLNGGSS